MFVRPSSVPLSLSLSLSLHNHKVACLQGQVGPTPFRSTTAPERWCTNIKVYFPEPEKTFSEWKSCSLRNANLKVLEKLITKAGGFALIPLDEMPDDWHDFESKVDIQPLPLLNLEDGGSYVMAGAGYDNRFIQQENKGAERAVALLKDLGDQDARRLCQRMFRDLEDELLEIEGVAISRNRAVIVEAKHEVSGGHAKKFARKMATLRGGLRDWRRVFPISISAQHVLDGSCHRVYGGSICLESLTRAGGTPAMSVENLH
eukprot:jgi/Chlat1/6326/Chrsp44S05796